MEGTKELIKSYRAFCEQIKAELIKAAKQYAEDGLNEVKVSSKAPLCGTVSFSTIVKSGMILSPEYYFLQAQANVICNQLESYKNPEDAITFLSEKVVKEGKAKVKGQFFIFHPIYRERIEKMLQDGGYMEIFA